MKITEIHPGLYRVDQDGLSHLGIGIGPARSKLASTALTSNQRNGCIFNKAGQLIGPWNFDGIVTHHDTLIAYGPWRDGAVPASELPVLEKTEALEKLGTIARAFSILQKEGQLSTRGLFLDSLFFFPDGSLLALPVFAQDAMLALRSLEEKKLSHELLRLPSAEIADSHAFGLAVMAYRVVIGEFPFDTNQDWHQTRSLIAHGVCQTPHCVFPQLDSRIEEIYQRFLISHKFGTDSLDEIARIIEIWQQNFNTAEPINSRNPAVIAFQKRVSRQKQRRFLQRYGLRIGFISLISVLVLSVPLSILGNVLRPLKTVGMGPIQVIEAYYSGFNSLDVSIMTDATTNGAGKQSIEQVTNIFVLDRIRYANERQKVHYTPAEWFRVKDTITSDQIMIFGIDGLKIQRITDSDASTHQLFLASFQKWSNLDTQDKPNPNNATPDRSILITDHQDQLELQQRSDGIWQIKEIKEIKTGQ